MIELGVACLVGGLIAFLYGAGAALYGGVKNDRRWVESSRRAVYAAAALLTVCVDRAGGGVPSRRLLGRAGRGPLLDDHADALQDDRDVGEPGRVAPAVGLGPLARVERGAVRHPAQAPRGRAVGDRGPVRAGGLLLRPDADRRRGVPVRAAQPGAGGRASGSTRCSAIRRWRSTRRCSTRATSSSRSRSRSRSARSSPVGSTPAGSARPAASACSPGSSSRAGSCSAPAGRTWSSAGAATGGGTRSRTRR